MPAAPQTGARLPAVLVVHENRGLNPHIEDITRRLALEGYLALAPDALTPLGGYPGDEERMGALWRCFQLGLSFPKEPSSVTQWWIMWRRVAGGLHADWQEAIYAKLRAPLRERRGDLP